MTVPTPTTQSWDEYHGVRVPTPYSWLEELDSEATSSWIRAQNTRTAAYLRGIDERRAVRSRLESIWSFPKAGVPGKHGDWYIQSLNTGLQNHDVIVKRSTLADDPSVLLDPNGLCGEGTVALTMTRFSRDGRWMAYGLSQAGSDRQEFRVRNVETAVDHSDLLTDLKFTAPSWTHDNGGFFYSRYPAAGDDALTAPNRDQRLYYHYLGRPQSEDLLIYARPDRPQWGFLPEVATDGRYAVIHVWKGTEDRNRIYLLDLDEPLHPNLRNPVVPLLDRNDAEYRFIGNVHHTFYFKTTLGAPRGRVIAIDLDSPGRTHWRTIIPESDEVIYDVALVGDRLIVASLCDVASSIRQYALDGSFEHEVPLPGRGYVESIDGERHHRELFFAYESFLTPPTIIRYDFDTRRTTELWKADIEFDASPYETKQVTYESKDGTSIPMFVTHATNLELDGRRPTILYGYGGFNHAMTPSFRQHFLAWLEMGGVLAVPALRGGNEYGEDWHAAGIREKKQNVFDDFIAAAEHLIAAGYTSPARLAISGRSNGGLLVGAVMTQRPELIGAALPAVGVLDMLRYHKFTIGWAWASEYGTADDAEQFAYLRAYSPLHNVRPATAYPATLVTTADHDDRVVPSHSFKFAAALQEAQAGPAPILIRIDVDAGHGVGKPTQKKIDEEADMLAFLVRVLDMEDVIERLRFKKQPTLSGRSIRAES